MGIGLNPKAKYGFMMTPLSKELSHKRSETTRTWVEKNRLAYGLTEIIGKATPKIDSKTMTKDGQLRQYSSTAGVMMGNVSRLWES